MKTQEQQREFDATMEQEAMSQGEFMAAAMHQHTVAYGEERKDDAWILSPFDTWEINPWYDGPSVPHPEDEDGQEEYYVVGQHAVNLYLAHLDDRLHAAWACGDDMVHKWHDANGTFNDLPF